jgi:hypothetical protein
MRSVEEIKKDIVSFAEQRKAGKPADRGVEGIVWAEYLNALTASIPLDRLEAICAAEKDGRCVVLPCKAGVDVYAVINKKVHDCVCVGWKWNGGNIYMLCMDRATGKEFSFFDFHFTGALSGLQTVFLSRAQAEAAKGAG